MQVLLAPIRLVYFVLGRLLYVKVYALIDSQFNIATFGTRHAGHVSLAALILVTTISAHVIKKWYMEPPLGGEHLKTSNSS